MVEPLAKYYGIPEYADAVISRFHIVPAQLLNRMFGFSKFGIAKAHAIVGYTALAGYVASVASLVTAGGTRRIDSIDEGITAGSALILSGFVSLLLYNNARGCDLVRARAKELDRQLELAALVLEEHMQRDRDIGFVGWYVRSSLCWGVIMGLFSWVGSVDMADPRILSIVGFATSFTTCIYGSRYILASPGLSVHDLGNWARGQVSGVNLRRLLAWYELER